MTHRIDGSIFPDSREGVTDSQASEELTQLEVSPRLRDTVKATTRMTVTSIDKREARAVFYYLTQISFLRFGLPKRVLGIQLITILTYNTLHQSSPPKDFIDIVLSLDHRRRS